MKTPLPLRRRFTLLAVVLGLALSGLAALTLLWVAEDYEYILSTEILQGQAEDYGLRLANGLPVQLPQTNRLRGYRAQDPDLPAAYAAYPIGVHEDVTNEDIHVGVFDTAAGKLIFVIDLGDIEAMERRLHLLVAGMLVAGGLLSGWLGWLISGIALQPLRMLARQVEALPVQPAQTQLAQNVSQDELGQLAHAIDAYQARLVDADANEQAFFADASHELRTPLTVIQGVTEVLLDDAAAPLALQARYARLQRGVDEMRNLLEAMLAAARRKPLQLERVDAAAFLQQAGLQATSGKLGLQVQVIAEGELQLAPREAELLIAGIGKRLLHARQTATLVLQRQGATLVLQVMPPQELSASAVRADAGTGSALLDRLAVRLGWTLRMQESSRVVLHME